jgi:hypothetical protein
MDGAQAASSGGTPRCSRHPMNAYGAQGNRVKKSSGEEACEEVVVPGGDFAFEA